jgi:hypothetical protein
LCNAFLPHHNYRPRPAVAPAGLPGHVAPGCFTISPARFYQGHTARTSVGNSTSEAFRIAPCPAWRFRAATRARRAPTLLLGHFCTRSHQFTKTGSGRIGKVAKKRDAFTLGPSLSRSASKSAGSSTTRAFKRHIIRMRADITSRISRSRTHSGDNTLAFQLSRSNLGWSPCSQRSVDANEFLEVFTCHFRLCVPKVALRGLQPEVQHKPGRI